jgi:hypothetical protein
MADLSKPLRTMKRIFILLLALLPFVSNAQGLEINHNRKNVTWSKVYESDLTQEEICDQILAYGILENTIIYGNMIAGDLHPMKLDYVSLGYKRMNLPLYISNDKFGCRIIIRFKGGRYKVEATNMFFESEVGSLGTARTSFFEYIDEDPSDEFRIIMAHLMAITSFSPLEEW